MATVNGRWFAASTSGSTVTTNHHGHVSRQPVQLCNALLIRFRKLYRTNRVPNAHLTGDQYCQVELLLGFANLKRAAVQWHWIV